jgi:hypothetical protein
VALAGLFFNPLLDLDGKIVNIRIVDIASTTPSFDFDFLFVTNEVGGWWLPLVRPLMTDD